jgi:putative heme iron utilization protein
MAAAPTPAKQASPEKELPEKVVRGIVQHVNEDHRQEMLECALAFGNTPWATDATLERFDRTGMDLRASGNGREQKMRLEFATPIQHNKDIQATMLELTEQARHKTQKGSS